MRDLRDRVRELERLLGRKTLESELLKQELSRLGHNPTLALDRARHRPRRAVSPPGNPQRGSMGRRRALHRRWPWRVSMRARSRRSASQRGRGVRGEETAAATLPKAMPSSPLRTFYFFLLRLRPSVAASRAQVAAPSSRGDLDGSRSSPSRRGGEQHRRRKPDKNGEKKGARRARSQATTTRPPAEVSAAKGECAGAAGGARVRGARARVRRRRLRRPAARGPGRRAQPTAEALSLSVPSARASGCGSTCSSWASLVIEAEVAGNVRLRDGYVQAKQEAMVGCAPGSSRCRSPPSTSSRPGPCRSRGADGCTSCCRITCC